MNNLDQVIFSFKNLQNLLFEYNNNVENFKEILNKGENKTKEIIEIFFSFCNIKDEIKIKFDNCIKDFYEFKNTETNNKYNNQEFYSFSKKEDIRIRLETQYFETPEDLNDIAEIREQVKLKGKEKEKNNKKSELINLVINNNNEGNKIEENNNYSNEESSESSFENYEDCNDDLENENQNEILVAFKSDIEKASKEKKILLHRSFSLEKSDFFDIRYNFIKRNALPFPIKCNNSMVSDMFKCITKDKVQLPIHYNEPLSMLQKQCEKFMYAKLLDKAATTQNPYLKLAYISGFIVSEVNCNINRVLKPFNPILGETFEFIDNDLKYRFFSEQVSHNPPISAFICESDNYVFFGDTRSKSKFNLFKGNMELNFLNKYNFLIKSTNDHFVFNKPTAFMKGLLFGGLHYDFKGLININNITNNKASATLEFFEEGKKEKNPGYFEGKIFDENKEIKYLIKGNWDLNLFITDKDGSNKIDIWERNKEEFLSNKDFLNNYLISSYSCKFNYLDENKKNNKKTQDNLEAILPITDSRFRKDQKYVEERKLDIADREKERLENLQRKRHKTFEEEKIKYSPNYFSETFDEKNNEYIYLFNGGYWEDRRDGKFGKLYDIFDNKNTLSDI